MEISHSPSLAPHPPPPTHNGSMLPSQLLADRKFLNFTLIGNFTVAKILEACEAISVHFCILGTFKVHLFASGYFNFVLKITRIHDLDCRLLAWEGGGWQGVCCTPNRTHTSKYLNYWTGLPTHTPPSPLPPCFPTV